MASSNTNTNAGDFSDPSSGGNFLERYRAARAGTSPATAPAAAPSSPPALKTASPPRSPASSKTQAVWSSTFHPLGRSAKSASRYDSGSSHGTGASTSEMLEKKTKTISLDGKALED